MERFSAGGKFAWGLILVLAIVHFDFWAWEDDSLVFGFMPIGLAYHAGLSILAAMGWALVVTFDWPEGIEEWAAAGDSDPAVPPNSQTAPANSQTGPANSQTAPANSQTAPANSQTGTSSKSNEI
ncbi:MAG: hypothetical protein ACI9F9_003086 [Candidatus Paceibacteria bacterium]|jgi:hypothetical protein